MTYGIRTGSIIQENNIAYSAQRDNSRWITNRTMLCWGCQKEVPRKLGRVSYAGGKTSGGSRGDITANNVRRFICFTCKPETP